jgi:hypothetical protein
VWSLSRWSRIRLGIDTTSRCIRTSLKDGICRLPCILMSQEIHQKMGAMSTSDRAEPSTGTIAENYPKFTDRLPTCGCAYDSVSGVRIPPVEVRWRRPLGLRGLSRMLAVVYLEWP